MYHCILTERVTKTASWADERGVETITNEHHFSDRKDVSVDELRKQVHEKGLEEADGTKEMLVSRLQASNKRRREE